MIPKFRACVRDRNGNNEVCEVLKISFDDEEVETDGGDWFNFDEVHLLQSTGMKDKNDVEIFEGDIVAVGNHPFQRKEDSGIGMEIEGNYAVGWNKHDLTWCAGDLLLARLKPYVRVIGNVYENRELLEVE